MRQRVDGCLPQHGVGILGQRLAARPDDGLESPGVRSHETQTAVDSRCQRAGALLPRGRGSGAGSDAFATHELHGGAAYVLAWFGREEHECRPQHAQTQGWCCIDGDAEIGQRPLEAILRHRRPSIGRERLIQGG